MSICLSRTTYKMYYPSELDPGKEGTTKGGYLEGEPTLPDYMRTFDDFHYGNWDVDLYKRNPWKHPGSAPVFSPCGILGGNPNGCPEVKFN